MDCDAKPFFIALLYKRWLIHAFRLSEILVTNIYTGEARSIITCHLAIRNLILILQCTITSSCNN